METISNKTTVQEQAQEALAGNDVFTLKCALRRALVELVDEDKEDDGGNR